jgi:holo-[acyl-carrier protein] synthase
VIVGIGVDVLGIGRVEHELRRDRHGFVAALFSPREVAQCEAGAAPAREYAVRFAAKEALFKALDAADRDASWWREAEVLRGPGGLPVVTLHGGVERRAHERAVRRILVSMSHTRDVAAATALLEDAGPEAAGPDPRGRHP